MRFFEENNMRKFLIVYFDNLDSHFKHLDQKYVIKDLRKSFQKTMSSIPKFSNYEKQFNRILLSAKAVKEATLKNIISFLKSEIKTHKKLQKKKKSQMNIQTEIEDCYAHKFLEQLQLMNLFISSNAILTH